MHFSHKLHIETLWNFAPHEHLIGWPFFFRGHNCSLTISKCATGGYRINNMLVKSNPLWHTSIAVLPLNLDIAYLSNPESTIVCKSPRINFTALSHRDAKFVATCYLLHGTGLI